MEQYFADFLDELDTTVANYKEMQGIISESALVKEI